MDPQRVPPLGRELALLELEEDDGLLEPGARWAEQWDPRPDLLEPINAGWIGEDSGGVWLCRHPEAALVDDEALWGIVERWRLGQREVTREDVGELSAWQLEALGTLIGADQREQRRRMQRREPDGKESESGS
jgi:hypothetical protein